VRKLDAPDLSSFEPGKGTAPKKPSRFKPRIELADKGKAGRAEGTLQGQGTQSLDVGGSYRVAKNLDVTAGVRINQENDRLAPLSDKVQDNQAVYVGTQFKF
jgi:predicted secreted protein